MSENGVVGAQETVFGAGTGKHKKLKSTISNVVLVTSDPGPVYS